jgi:two-component system sensor histidine kinase BaeS
VAHDLRTPVAALRAQLDAMTDGVLPITGERLAQVSAELGRVERLIDDLGELARIESPDLRPRIVALRGDDLAAELQGRFGSRAEQLGVDFEVAAPPGTEIRADPHLLKRALDNVVQNALQYAGAGGWVRFRAGSGEQGTTIRVENTGTVPQSDLERVFDRMYRGQQARSNPGSGLGLAIARAVVQRHGGSIDLTNSGRGTVVVRIDLP